jgi:hypothetical protein
VLKVVGEKPKHTFASNSLSLNTTDLGIIKAELMIQADFKTSRILQNKQLS